MDAQRFDAIARLLSARLPRRASLAAIAGTAFGAVALSDHDVLGKKKKKKCKGDTKKCGKKCIPKSECCGSCGAKTCCSGTCIDLTSDPSNCGACNRKCSKQECINGACGCGLGVVCPVTCNCFLTIDSSKLACAGAAGASECNLNSECPLGTVCRQTAGGNFCSEPC